MALSAAQITDLEQIIMTSIERVGDPTSKNLLIAYLLDAFKLQAVLANQIARNALENILEKKYLVAYFWLNNKTFLSKGETGQEAPTPEEIADAMFSRVKKERKNGTIPSVYYNFFYGALVHGKTVESENPDQAYLEKNQTIQELLDAVYAGNIDYLKKKVNQSNINNSYPPYGDTLLSYAVMAGQAGVVDFLLMSHHADPNILDHNGNSPLQLAVSKIMPEAQTNSRPATLNGNQLEIVKYLCRLGSKVDIKDKQGQTPIDVLTALSVHDETLKEIILPMKALSRGAQKVNAQTLEVQDLINRRQPPTLFDECTNGLIQLIRTSASLDDFLKHKFTTRDNESFTFLEWVIQKSAFLEPALQTKAFKVIKQCTQSCPDIIQQMSQGQYTSPLTFALEQAFQARYTYKETYLQIAQYLLLKGAKAGPRDLEIIESFYPDIPEAILELTNFKTEFEGLNAQVSRYDAEQAQKSVLEKTRIRFEIVRINQRFVLQHQANFHCTEPQDRHKQRIQTDYGNHQLGIQESVKSIGMGWNQSTLTIPTQVIPQICQNNFSALIKASNPPQPLPTTKEAKNEEKIRAIKAATRELNLSRTKSIAMQTYKKLKAVMPNQWQLVATQEGYELQYPIGFSREKEKFDNSKFQDRIKMFLNAPALEERQVVTSRGSNLYQLAIKSTDMQTLRGRTETENQTITLLGAPFFRRDELDLEEMYVGLKLIGSDPVRPNTTPLSLAIAKADVDAVKRLLDLKVQINQKNGEGNTSLKQAILKASPQSNDPNFHPEKINRYKQIVLLLVRNGALIDPELDPDSSATLILELLQKYRREWTPEIQRELDRLKREKLDSSAEAVLSDDFDFNAQSLSELWNPNPPQPSSSSTASSTSKQKHCLDPVIAKELLQQVKPALLQLHQAQQTANTTLLQCDEQFVPNIIGALEAISEQKTFAPIIAPSGISSFKSLSNDAHECLLYLFEKQYPNEAKTHFKAMIDHYCENNPLLKETLNRFGTTAADLIRAPSTTASSSSTTSSASTVSSSGPTTNNITSHDTHVENLIEAWEIQQPRRNTAFNKVGERLDHLKRECMKEVNFLLLSGNPNASSEKIGDIAKIVTLTDCLVNVLNNEQNLNEKNEEINELVQDFRKQIFTTNERIYIAIISFLDSVLSVILPESYLQREEESQFRFFQPFEGDKVKRGCLEFSEVLDTSLEEANTELPSLQTQ